MRGIALLAPECAEEVGGGRMRQAFGIVQIRALDAGIRKLENKHRKTNIGELENKHSKHSNTKDLSFEPKL